MRDLNLGRLIAAASLLRPLLNELVFVGGSIVGLLANSEASAEPRSTFDVDAIVESESYSQYAVFGSRLKRLGFREDLSEDAPLCRWRQAETILDVLPLDESILGFSNRWYRMASQTSQRESMKMASKFAW